MLGSNTPSLDESVVSTEVAATSSSKRKRGAGILWKFVDYHQDIEMALRRFDQCNEPEETRVLGRVNEGKNTAYYYYCPKKSAGCTKQWRICTLNDSENVVEEESPCEHSCHELYRRNGGRGLSFDHLDMIKEAMDSGLTRTKGILDFFDKKRRSLMIADPSAEVLNVPSATQVSKYLAMVKGRRLYIEKMDADDAVQMAADRASFGIF